VKRKPWTDAEKRGSPVLQKSRLLADRGNRNKLGKKERAKRDSVLLSGRREKRGGVDMAPLALEGGGGKTSLRKRGRGME